MLEIMLEDNKILRRDQFYPFRKIRKHKNTLHRDEWQTITREFNKMIMDEIVYNGFEFILPYRLGIIRISKRKIKKSYIDENGNLIVYYMKMFNGNRFIPSVRTDYMYRFSWSNKVIKNVKAYAFIPSKKPKRKLIKILNDPFNTMDYQLTK